MFDIIEYDSKYEDEFMSLIEKEGDPRKKKFVSDSRLAKKRE